MLRPTLRNEHLTKLASWRFVCGGVLAAGAYVSLVILPAVAKHDPPQPKNLPEVPESGGLGLKLTVSLFQLKDKPEGSEGLAKRGVSFRFAIQAMLARVSDGLPTERADPPLARIGKGPIRHARGLKPDGKLAFKH